MKKPLKGFIVLIFISLAINLTGCLREQVFTGEGKYWKSKLVQLADPEFIELSFKYIGDEEYLSSIEYEFTSKEHSSSGSERIDHKPPYIYSVKYQKVGGEKITTDSLGVKIKWNNKEEEINMKK